MKQFPRSPDNRYVFPICSVSGCKSFANQEYFAKTLAKKYGGSEERMIAEYACREAKKYLADGFSKEEIVELAKKNKGKLPKIAPKISKEKIPKKVKKVKLTAVKVEKVVEVVNGVSEEVVKKTYPWTNDPSYFGTGERHQVDYSTSSCCHRPNYYLDSMCHGCPVYDKCGFVGKYKPDDHLKKSKKPVAVIKPIAAFSQEELEAEKSTA